MNSDSSYSSKVIPRDAIRLTEIASHHRQVMISLLVIITAWVVGRMDVGPILKIICDLFIAVGAFGYGLGVFFLGRTFHGTLVAVLMALVAMVPCVGLIVVGMLDQTVKRELRDHGIEIGLLGVSSTEVLDRLKR